MSACLPVLPTSTGAPGAVKVKQPSAPTRSNRPSSLGGGCAGRGSWRPFAANQSGLISARRPARAGRRGQEGGGGL